jgi:1,4-dihydroxy-2-naphthoate octaprenyltransferase
VNFGPGELIVFVVILGAICAALAHQKGRRPAGYFVLGALLPVIGLVMVIAMRPARTTTPLIRMAR